MTDAEEAGARLEVCEARATAARTAYQAALQGRDAAEAVLAQARQALSEAQARLATDTTAAQTAATNLALASRAASAAHDAAADAHAELDGATETYQRALDAYGKAKAASDAAAARAAQAQPGLDARAASLKAQAEELGRLARLIGDSLPAEGELLANPSAADTLIGMLGDYRAIDATASQGTVANAQTYAGYLVAARSAASRYNELQPEVDASARALETANSSLEEANGALLSANLRLAVERALREQDAETVRQPQGQQKAGDEAVLAAVPPEAQPQAAVQAVACVSGEATEAVGEPEARPQAASRVPGETVGEHALSRSQAAARAATGAATGLPQTGDAGNAALPLALAGLGTLAAGAIARRRRALDQDLPRL